MDYVIHFQVEGSNRVLAVEKSPAIIPNVGEQVVVADRKNLAETHTVTKKIIDYTESPALVTILVV